MALNGTLSRFVSSFTLGAGSPGGTLGVTVIAVPTGTYPANGEPIATLLLGTAAAGGLVDSRIKVASGVKPDNVFITDNLGHNWQYDQVLGTLRNYTTVGATPTEHATGAYGGNEASALIRLTFMFPLYSDLTR